MFVFVTVLSSRQGLTSLFRSGPGRGEQTSWSGLMQTALVRMGRLVVGQSFFVAGTAFGRITMLDWNACFASRRLLLCGSYPSIPPPVKKVVMALAEVRPCQCWRGRAAVRRVFAREKSVGIATGAVDDLIIVLPRERLCEHRQRIEQLMACQVAWENDAQIQSRTQAAFELAPRRERLLAVAMAECSAYDRRWEQPAVEEVSGLAPAFSNASRREFQSPVRTGVIERDGVQKEEKGVLKIRDQSGSPKGAGVTDVINQGNDHFKRQEFELAVEAYTRAIAVDPEIFRMSARLGQMIPAFAKECWEVAELDAKRALQLDPANAKAMYRRAICLRKLGRLHDALGVLEDNAHSENKAFQQLRNEAAQGCQIWSSSSSVSSAEGGWADVNWRRPKDGNAALHLAAEWGHLEVVQLLLDSRADPELHNNYSMSPFALAAHGSDVENLLAKVTRPLAEDRRYAMLLFFTDTSVKLLVLKRRRAYDCDLLARQRKKANRMPQDPVVGAEAAGAWQLQARWQGRDQDRWEEERRQDNRSEEQMRQEEQEMVERVRREAFGEASGGHPMLMPICLNFGVSCSCTDTGRSASFKRLAVAFARQYARSRVIERRSCDQMFSKPSHHVPMFRRRRRPSGALAAAEGVSQFDMLMEEIDRAWASRGVVERFRKAMEFASLSSMEALV
ncbi:Protein unc-45-like A [Symbiodinium microadriaticum]|uniref:Protein unc-45-like A n=1 Tax=Symbiodinium microadriaticum TaxID=2951 RepID=A0A1Q9DJ86_SYMMI|nr:Protein unc-45-like A [Symbiodinium microadriaticum]